jgi:YidC/Oxa1 family membrane protein insertase
MALFQEHGVNPLAACLPLLFQIPVFIALYDLLRSSGFENLLDESGEPGFLFIPDLAEHPTGGVLVALIILAVGGMFLTIALNPSPQTGGATQRYMFAGIFAVVTALFIPNLPAGIAVYFIASGLWQLGQQTVIHFVWPLPAIPTPEEVKAARPPPPPPRKRKRRR